MKNCCGTCIFWKETTLEDNAHYYAPSGSGWGVCDRIKMGDEVGVAETDIVCTKDASSYFAALFSKEGFGCNLHKEKTSN